MLSETLYVLRAPRNLLLTTKAAATSTVGQIRLAHTSGASPLRRQNKFTNDAGKAGGDISDAFASMSGGSSRGLSPRYAELKRKLLPSDAAQKEVVAAWRDVLQEVESLTANIRRKSGSVGFIYS